MPLPIEFDLDVLLVQGQHCLNVGLRDMKVTLHDVCGGLLATAVFMKPVCLILGQAQLVSSCSCIPGVEAEVEGRLPEGLSDGSGLADGHRI